MAMTNPPNFTALTPAQIAKAERDARLAERLRANLRRRKDVKRKHKGQDVDRGEDKDRDEA